MLSNTKIQIHKTHGERFREKWKDNCLNDNNKNWDQTKLRMIFLVVKYKTTKYTKLMAGESGRIVGIVGGTTV